MASKLGAHTITVVPGNGYPEMDYKKGLELSASSLKKIGEFPEDVGIKVGVEEVWNRIPYSPIEYSSFIRDLGENLGAYFDVGNVMEMGHPTRWIREVRDIIIGVHFKDYDVQEKGLFPFFMEMCRGRK